jgi:hypothetical protein
MEGKPMFKASRLFLLLLALLLPLSAQAGTKTIILGVTPTPAVAGDGFCPPGFTVEARMFTEGIGGWKPESVNGVPVRLVETPYGQLLDRLNASFGCRVGNACYDSTLDANKDGVVGIGDFAKAVSQSPLADRGTYAKGDWHRKIDPNKCTAVTYPDQYDPTKNLFIACIDPSTGVALQGQVGNETYYWRGPASVGGPCTAPQ